MCFYHTWDIFRQCQLPFSQCFYLQFPYHYVLFNVFLDNGINVREVIPEVVIQIRVAFLCEVEKFTQIMRVQIICSIQNKMHTAGGTGT